MNESNRNAYIDELERNIMIYESDFHSGNKTLDVLLNEKKLICDTKEIQFTFLGDASGLSFIDVIDLYTIFANALDNAIEAAEKQKKKKRLISIHIAKLGSITNIHIENTCREAITFKNGLPVTTKKDQSRHGIGVKSMKQLVEKYGGVIEYRRNTSTFVTEVLLTAP